MAVVQQIVDLLRGTDPLQLITKTIIAVAVLIIVKGVYNLYIRKGHRY